MKKKLFAWVLIFAMLAALAGCGTQEESSVPQSSEEQTSAVETAAPEQSAPAVRLVPPHT